MTDYDESIDTLEDAPETPVTPPPRYVDENTLRETLTAFGQQIINELRPPKQAQADPDEEAVLEHDRRFVEKRIKELETRTNSQAEAVSRPLVLREVVNTICEGMPQEVKDEFRDTLKGMDTMGLAGSLNDKEALKHMKRLAKGIHAEMKGTEAPSSSPSGTRGGSSYLDNAEIEQLAQGYLGTPDCETMEKARKFAKEIVDGRK